MRKVILLLGILMCFIPPINSSNDLKADFYWEPYQPTDTEFVKFFDNSTGDIVAWIWYFGDGNSSTEKNPTYKYPDNGIYSVRLVIWDANGNMDYIQKNITILNVPPVADAGENIILNNYTVIFNANLSYDVDGSIVKYVWDFGDGKTSYGSIIAHTYSNEGFYTVNLTVYDNDNASAKDTIFVLIDVTPPQTTYNLSEVKEWYNKEVMVTLSSKDNLSGVNATFYKINDGEWIVYNGSFNVSNEGINKVYFYSTDNAGNAEKEKNFTLKMDYTPPKTNYTINAKYGKNGWIVSNAKIKLFAADALSGVNATFYKINDGEWKKYEKEFSISTNGSHTIHFYSIDKTGNVEEKKNFTIRIDKEIPSLKIVSPKEGYIYIANRKIMSSLFGNTIIIGKFVVEAEANDGISGIDYVEFILNDEILWKDYVAPYTTPLPQGFSFNELKVIAYDKAGNSVESSKIRYVKIL